MGVGPDDGGDVAVEVPAEADLLACGLGVHVDEDVVDLALELADDGVGGREGRAPGLEEDVAAQVDHAEPHAVAFDHRVAVAGLGGEVVGRPQDVLVGVQVGPDLLAVVGVVAERDDVDAGREELVGDLRGDPETGGRVLPVGHHEGRCVLLAEPGKEAEQSLAAEAPDDVADEEDPGGRVSHRPTVAAFGSCGQRPSPSPTGPAPPSRP